MKFKSKIILSIFFNIIFAKNVLADGNTLHHYNNQFDFAGMVIPLGITTLVSIVITLTLGFFIKKNRKILLLWHKWLAFTTLTLAIIHALIVLIFH